METIAIMAVISLIISNLLLTGVLFYIISGKTIDFNFLRNRFKRQSVPEAKFDEPEIPGIDEIMDETDEEYADRMKEESLLSKKINEGITKEANDGLMPSFEEIEGENEGEEPDSKKR